MGNTRRFLDRSEISQIQCISKNLVVGIEIPRESESRNPYYNAGVSYNIWCREFEMNVETVISGRLFQ